ncbi:hypothetical protein KY360_05865 [Candidatus Woesearchaeota archaeon]|nr:hypothetical protein [Candidatus Woesearchaeota archaeon]
MKKPDKQKLTLMILAVLLVLAIGYIALDMYMGVKQRQQMGIFQQGMRAGYEQAIKQLMEKAPACQPIPVYAGNQTVEFIAVDCLQLAQE